MKERRQRISDLQFFLVLAAVFGIGNFLRSGLALALLSVAAVAVVVLVLRAWTNRAARS